MADAATASVPEKCGRCHVGNLFVISEDDESELLKCFNCEHGLSRVKDGYEVTEPGAPITKVEVGTDG